MSHAEKIRASLRFRVYVWCWLNFSRLAWFAEKKAMALIYKAHERDVEEGE